MILLSIDYGTRKCGLAYSVESFAFGLTTVKTGELLDTLEKIIYEKSVTSIILGMPYNIDGSFSPHARRVMEFKKNLESRFSLPIILHDERLTTSEARIGFAETGQVGDLDMESARLILESYLSKKA